MPSGLVHVFEAAKRVLVVTHLIVRDSLDLFYRYGLGDETAAVSVGGLLLTVEERRFVADKPQMRGALPSRNQYRINVPFPVTYFDDRLSVGHAAECLKFPDREREHIERTSSDA